MHGWEHSMRTQEWVHGIGTQDGYTGMGTWDAYTGWGTQGGSQDGFEGPCLGRPKRLEAIEVEVMYSQYKSKQLSHLQPHTATVITVSSTCLCVAIASLFL